MTSYKPKTMWSVREGHHIFVYWNGQVIYKRTIDKKGKKKQPSILFNKYWPNEEIV